jgi:hypothetical protein
MTKKQLKGIIREIVREEVALSIKEVIRELKAPTASKPKVAQPKPSNVKYSKNKVLNEVLNETANSDEEWGDMGDGTYTTDTMGDILKSSYGEILTPEQNGQINPDAMVASMGIRPDTVSDSVKSIFTKDYRSLMKKMDNKRK